MLSSGDILAQRYEIVRSLGEGGFSYTYLAKDHQRYNKLCVVKHLCRVDNNPDALEDAKRRFHKEAEQLHKFGASDQIPELFAIFEEKGELYIVQEFIDGVDLQTELTRKTQMSEAEVIQLLKDILSIVRILHLAKGPDEKSVIHRDLKPSNIMRRSSDQKLVLIDFGSVKEIRIAGNQKGKPQDSTTHVVHSKGYTAPEQMKGHPLLASDVYSVGAIAIHALTGHPPGRLYNPMTDTLMWQKDVVVSTEFREILEKMLEHQAGNRYADADAALAALDWISQISHTPTCPASDKIEVDQRTERNVSTLEKKPVITRETFHFRISRFPLSFTEKTIGRITKKGFRRGTLLNHRLDDNGDVNLKMVEIPAGTFLMGSPESEEGREKWEESQHGVSVPTFFMAQTPITQAQWRSVAKMDKVNIELNLDPSHFKGDRRPVEQISWYEAVEFCDRLSRVSGLHYRLPSEAEWEYACRSGTDTPFYFDKDSVASLMVFEGFRRRGWLLKIDDLLGTNLNEYHPYTYSRARLSSPSSGGRTNYEMLPPFWRIISDLPLPMFLLELMGNFVGKINPWGEDWLINLDDGLVNLIINSKTIKVGTLLPNAWGLYDMHGNVSEWCAGFGGKDRKPTRGGSFAHSTDDCRSSSSGGHSASEPWSLIGFRVAFTLPKRNS